MTTDTDLARVLADIRRIDTRLLDAVDPLSDAEVRAPSRLPGWSRGHVLAHLAGLGAAVARQLERAVTDTERVDFYDGGRTARDAAIEAGAQAGAAEHRQALRATVGRVEKALAKVTPEVLDRPTGYRERPVRAVVSLWWREVEIHATDLGVGIESAGWSPALRAHLHDYLADRVPDRVQVDLAPTDVDERRAIGGGETVTVRGTANDLAAWLAGRAPTGEVVAEREGVGVPLPDLRPWP